MLKLWYEHHIVLKNTTTYILNHFSIKEPLFSTHFCQLFGNSEKASEKNEETLHSKKFLLHALNFQAIEAFYQPSVFLQMANYILVAGGEILTVCGVDDLVLKIHNCWFFRSQFQLCAQVHCREEATSWHFLTSASFFLSFPTRWYNNLHLFWITDLRNQ